MRSAPVRSRRPRTRHRAGPAQRPGRTGPRRSRTHRACREEPRASGPMRINQAVVRGVPGSKPVPSWRAGSTRLRVNLSIERRAVLGDRVDRTTPQESCRLLGNRRRCRPVNIPVQDFDRVAPRFGPGAPFRTHRSRTPEAAARRIGATPAGDGRGSRGDRNPLPRGLRARRDALGFTRLTRVSIVSGHVLGAGKLNLTVRRRS